MARLSDMLLDIEDATDDAALVCDGRVYVRLIGGGLMEVRFAGIDGEGDVILSEDVG